MKKIAIYGAKSIALGTYYAVRTLAPRRNVICFLVSHKEGNPTSLCGLQVNETSLFIEGLPSEEKNNIEVLIATPENIMPEIEETLDKAGLYCHVRVDAMRWSEMMGSYFLWEQKFIPLGAVPIGSHDTNIKVYMAKFHKDKPLQHTYTTPPYIVPIQVGAVLCEDRVADMLDCDGDNISGKNGNYSELTALYWIWKNRLSNRKWSDNIDYFGLAHYRRILSLSGDDLKRLECNNVDVVLPYPMPYEPNIEEHHKRYICESDWNALLTALGELQPAYAEAFPVILKQQYLYNYNIILAKADVLEAYCEWLFPILERVEQLSVPKGWERADRYIGYMGETLETLYFMYNRERLNVVHTGCLLLT